MKEVADMEEGGRYGSVTVRDMKIFLSICYEAILPTFTRKGIRETGADMIVNLTNDGWFGPDEAPEQHLMVQAQRAVELRVPLLRATNTGISALVDQTGGVTYRSTPDTEETMTVEITAKPLFSFYREYGDIFVFLTFLASLAAVLLKSRL
ncbi:MAG: hypothetical protein FJ088_15875 [Deltaproteobacteria bacterium]|nr:hypothetical protein [Deltaproteobacteria bacterium]